MNIIYKKNEKITAKFETSDNTNVINKACLIKSLSKIEVRISYIKKDYNEIKLHNSKQSIEEFLIERAVITTIQILFDKGLFDEYDIEDEVLQPFFLIELNQRRRPDLNPINNDDDVIQRFYSFLRFKK